MFLEGVWGMAAFGLLGGLARALYGASKAAARGEPLRPVYFLLTLIVSGVLGALVGSLIELDYRASAILGYVGTDFLENVTTAMIPKQLLIHDE